MRKVRQQRKPRSSQAAPEAVNSSAQLVLIISGFHREFRQGNYSPVPLV
jgi:hypothetical protein